LISPLNISIRPLSKGHHGALKDFIKALDDLHKACKDFNKALKDLKKARKKLLNALKGLNRTLASKTILRTPKS